MSSYRPDIDGLRAVAVLLVVFNHAGWGLFAGGYIGVDVFFVISGFLITRIIVEEIESTGRFDFPNFYARRVRRLFPALWVTLAFSSIAAFLLFPPSDLVAYARSLLASVFFIANFHFWDQAEYFGPAADSMPLLHIWSLSVEEQFYFIWPTLLLLVSRMWSMRAVILVAAGLGASSLTLAVWVTHVGPQSDWWVERYANELLDPVASATFYLLPFRVVEFVIGALAFWWTRRFSLPSLWSEGQFVAGLLCIVAAAVLFTDQTPFPYYTALLPCLGAALVITANQPCYARKLLSNPFMIFVGLISYSLYLVHWPIFVFSQYLTQVELTVARSIVAIIVSLAVAAVMYWYVEVPFRKRRWTRISRIRLFAGVGTLCALLAVPAYSAVQQSGWTWRILEEYRQLPNIDAYHEKFFGGVGMAEHQVVRLGGGDGPPRLLIVGDSYARQYANAVDELLLERSEIGYGLFDHGCFFAPDLTRYIKGTEDQRCSQKYEKAKRLMDRYPQMDVVIANHWAGYSDTLGERGAGHTLSFDDDRKLVALKTSQMASVIIQNGSERRYLFIGMPPESPGNILRCLRRPMFIDAACDTYSPRRQTQMHSELRKLAGKNANVEFIDAQDALCTDRGCPSILEGLPVYTRGSHLSVAASERVVHAFGDVLLPLGTR